MCAFVFRLCARYTVVSQTVVTKSITRASVRLVRLARRRVLCTPRAARPHATVILPHTCNVRHYFTLSTVPSQLQRRQFLSNKDGLRKSLTEGSDIKISHKMKSENQNILKCFAYKLTQLCVQLY